MNHKSSFINPTILKIIIFLVIGYFIVPLFFQPSLCLDLLANEPNNKISQTLPCITLATIPEHSRPVYVTKNTITYQQYALYNYDLSTQYISPVVNLLVAYFIACGLSFIFLLLVTYLKKEN